MAFSCAPGDLLSAAAAFEKLSDRELQVCATYLLALAAGGSADPAVILNSARAFNKVSPEGLLQMQVYLLCVANGGS